MYLITRGDLIGLSMILKMGTVEEISLFIHNIKVDGVNFFKYLKTIDPNTEAEYSVNDSFKNKYHYYCNDYNVFLFVASERSIRVSCFKSKEGVKEFYELMEFLKNEKEREELGIEV